MGWVKQIPAWVWLLLAVSQVPKLVFASVFTPMALARIPLMGLFLGLALSRYLWWQSTTTCSKPAGVKPEA